MASDTICLIVGTSGVGKSTVANCLHNKYGLKILQSYTTRPKRDDGETGHTFITDNEFIKLKNICAYTEIKGYKYGATSEQVDNADIYIIDEIGISYFDKMYKGNKKIKIVKLEADIETCILRMRERGDASDDIHFRAMFDKNRTKQFYDIINNAKNISKNNMFIIDIEQKTPEEIADYIYKYVF